MRMNVYMKELTLKAITGAALNGDYHNICISIVTVLHLLQKAKQLWAFTKMFSINSNHRLYFHTILLHTGYTFFSTSHWGLQAVCTIRVIVFGWYEVPVGACCLTEHVGPLLLPVECQQAAQQ